MMCGGTSDVKAADEAIQAIINELRPAVEGKCPGKNFSQYTAVQYKTQVVAGTNYFVKVNIGGEHIHLRIHQPLPHTGQPNELSDVQLGKSEADPIEYF